MGAKQTKLDGSEYFLPQTPELKLIKPYNHREFLNAADGDQLDPRSPSGCRTPIKLFHTATAQQQEKPETVVELEPTATSSESGNSLKLLRKRFLKGLTYSANDPRSPAPELNRTPLVFEGEKTLNLDDTFSDLFVESRVAAGEAKQTTPKHVPRLEEVVDAPFEVSEEMHVDTAFVTAPHMDEEVQQQQQEESYCNSSAENSTVFSSFIEEEGETMPCPALLKQTPPLASFQLQKPLDPRSPSIGVDRTPIIFTDDDDEGAEDAMLENILATLSLQLNTSNASSSDLSFGTPCAKPLLERSQEEMGERMLSVTNKPLERVRFGAARKPATRKRHAHRPRIYEDRENANSTTSALATTSPRRPQLALNAAGKRTPLSCVKNRSHLRAHSVELPGKTLKLRLPLNSVDDSIKRANHRMIQDELELV